MKVQNNVTVKDQDGNSSKPLLSIVLSCEKGTTSFCDNHGTRYWKFVCYNLKKWADNYIVTYDNDLICNKKYHCYIDYFGCIGVRQFETNNFKDAVFWMNEKLKNYR